MDQFFSIYYFISRLGVRALNFYIQTHQGLTISWVLHITQTNALKLITITINSPKLHLLVGFFLLEVFSSILIDKFFMNCCCSIYKIYGKSKF